ncbi:MAG: hypothetical protein HYR88_04515, partial [Verrucomicrobia bacterium]|nr:hypothetical protein [Verrucomicrobiota bacterium]
SVADTGVRFVDLGSTNGSFIENEPVSEAALQPGQQIRIGDVVLRFESTESAPVAKKVGIRIAGHEPPASPSASGEAEAAASPPNIPSGPMTCRYHAKSPATRWCPKCQKAFCSLCVTQLCKTCGTPCATLDASAAYQLADEPSFYKQIPGVFAYPFKGNGAWMIGIGSVLYVFMNFASRFSRLVWIALMGYAALYGQGIIHASAQGDDRGPQWPDADGGVRAACFQFMAACAISFLPVLALVFFADLEQPWAIGCLITFSLAGLVYLPMGLLSVAMFDSVAAVNPMVVAPAILRIPLAYLTTIVLLGALVCVSYGIDVVISLLIPVPFVPSVIGSLFSMYFFTVAMRLLGVMYYSKRREIGWFNS